jgi:hypothetical protein
MIENIREKMREFAYDCRRIVYAATHARELIAIREASEYAHKTACIEKARLRRERDYLARENARLRASLNDLEPDTAPYLRRVL